MKFITIQNQLGQTVAVNPERITHIAIAHDSVVIFLGSGEQVFTQFTNLRSAVEYVERATSERSWKEIQWSKETHLDNSRPTVSEVVQIFPNEVARLMTKGANSTTVAVYLCLLSNKNHCNLDVKSINKWIGNPVEIRQIHKCLKWLHDNDFIIRNDDNSNNKYQVTRNNESQLSEDSL
jgi:hypothetical protein